MVCLPIPFRTVSSYPEGDIGNRSQSSRNHTDDTSGNSSTIPTSSYCPTRSFWLKTVSILPKSPLCRLTIPGNFGDQFWPAQSNGGSSNNKNTADSKAWSTAVEINSVAGGVVNRSKKQSAGGSTDTGSKGK